MWRVSLLTVVFIAAASSSASAQVTPGDFECTPCGERCEQLGLDADDTLCAGLDTGTRIDPRFGMELPHLLVPHAHVAPTAPLPAQLLPDVTEDHDDGLFLRLHGPLEDPAVGVGIDGYQVETPQHKPSDTDHVELRLDGRDDAPVARVSSPQVYERTADDGQTTLRIHGDDEPTDDTEHVEIEDTGQFDDQQQQQPDDPPEFITGYVDWEFVPVIEVQHVEGAVSEVDVQRTLQNDEQPLSECFNPREYPGHGALNVDLHLSYNGIVQAVNGSTDGIPPEQARCMLERAWGYEFPRLAEDADEPSEISYRIEFVGQRLDMPDPDPDRPKLLVERMHTAEPQLDEPVAQAMTDRLDEEIETCAAGGLVELPQEVTATEVHGTWRQIGDGQYEPAQLDITVHNKTSSQLPSNEHVDCYRRALLRWDFQLDADDIEDIQQLPDELNSSFWVTVRPAGWHGR